MTVERLSARISKRRMDKLRATAAEQDKKITQLISDWIDSLPEPKILSKVKKKESVEE
jgi:hypothetical protein